MSSSTAYRAYLLRLWRMADGCWRAARVDPHTGEQRAFATLEHCWAYLLGVTRPGFNSAASPAGEETDLLD